MTSTIQVKTFQRDVCSYANIRVNQCWFLFFFLTDEHTSLNKHKDQVWRHVMGHGGGTQSYPITKQV